MQIVLAMDTNTMGTMDILATMDTMTTSTPVTDIRPPVMDMAMDIQSILGAMATTQEYKQSK